MDKKRPSVWTWVFVIKDWKILVWKRKSNLGDGTWSLPWWHLEFWETFEECGIRETLEESWVNIRNIKYLWISNDVTENKHYVTIFMNCFYKWWEPHVTDFDEFYEWEWFDLKELPKNLFPIFENFLNDNFDLVKKILKNN